MNYKHFYNFFKYKETLVSEYSVKNVYLLFTFCHCMYMLFNAITVYRHSSTDVMLAFAISLTFFFSPQSFNVFILGLYVSEQIWPNFDICLHSCLRGWTFIYNKRHIQCKISRWYSLVRHEINLVDCMTSISFLS